MTLGDFLNWFEGFSENIEGAPNPKQWQRIVEKLGALKASTPHVEIASPMHRPIEFVLAEPVGGAATTERFRARVREILMDNETLSLDPETADAELRKARIDLTALNMEPAEFAQSILSSMQD